MTTASTTQFASRILSGPGGYRLYFDGNSKITGGNGTYDQPAANAFSLLQVADCPGATDACKTSCYVHLLAVYQPELHERYRHNSRTIRRILAGEGCSSLDWAEAAAAYIRENAAAGFRWHVSGDVFSAQYAAWIVQVCERSPDVKHWLYTRSFQYVPTLVEASNLVVNLSADRDNYADARRWGHAYGLRLCYMSTDKHDVPKTAGRGDVLFPVYRLRGDTEWLNALPRDVRRGICPVDMFGKSRHIRCGVCTKCLGPVRGGVRRSMASLPVI